MAQANMNPNPVEANPVFVVDQFGNQLQGNTDGVVLITAVLATSGVSSGPIQQNDARGVKLFLNVTTIGIGGALVVIVEAIDPFTNNAIALFTLGTPVATNGFTTYTVHPELTAGVNVAKDVLPRTWQVRVTGEAVGGSSFTLSGSYLK